jgi:hypothetical protein
MLNVECWMLNVEWERQASCDVACLIHEYCAWLEKRSSFNIEHSTFNIQHSASKRGAA